MSASGPLGPLVYYTCNIIEYFKKISMAFNRVSDYFLSSIIVEQPFYFIRLDMSKQTI